MDDMMEAQLEKILFFEVETQKLAKYPNRGSNKIYPLLGLVGELGEFAEKIKKTYRDYDGVFDDERKRLALLELGDFVWYIEAYAYENQTSMSAILKQAGSLRYPRRREVAECIFTMGRYVSFLTERQRGSDTNSILHYLISEVADAAYSLDSNFFLVCEMNYQKLMARHARGTIQGEGDAR